MRKHNTVPKTKSTTRFGNIRSPGYALAITWISEIWEQFPRDLIVRSFQLCGITGLRQYRDLHSPLRHILTKGEVIQDMIVEGLDNEDEMA